MVRHVGFAQSTCRSLILEVFWVLYLVVVMAIGGSTAIAQEYPNIVVVLADDLGLGEN